MTEVVPNGIIVAFIQVIHCESNILNVCSPAQCLFSLNSWKAPNSRDLPWVTLWCLYVSSLKSQYCNIYLEALRIKKELVCIIHENQDVFLWDLTWVSLCCFFYLREATPTRPLSPKSGKAAFNFHRNTLCTHWTSAGQGVTEAWLTRVCSHTNRQRHSEGKRRRFLLFSVTWN